VGCCFNESNFLGHLKDISVAKRWINRNFSGMKRLSASWIFIKQYWFATIVCNKTTTGKMGKSILHKTFSQAGNFSGIVKFYASAPFYMDAIRCDVVIRKILNWILYDIDKKLVSQVVLYWHCLVFRFHYVFASAYCLWATCTDIKAWWTLKFTC